MSKEPGQIAYEARFPERRDPIDEWEILPDEYKTIWAAVETAVRADERRKVIEECAGKAEGEAYGFPPSDLTEHGQGYERACKEIAAAIRALGEKDA